MDRQHIDAVVLDLDGVITRTMAVHAQAWKQRFDAWRRAGARFAGQRRGYGGAAPGGTGPGG